MSLHYVLTNYPPSNQFRAWVEAEVGATPTYLSVPELRRLRPPAMLRQLRNVKADVLYIPIEDENSSAILPALKLIAGLSSARRIEVIGHDRSRVQMSRLDALTAFTGMMRHSVAGILSARAARKEIQIFLREPRIALSPSKSNRVLYLNANLWFGVKAGGSVGHISGVANAFLRWGREVTFASAGDRLLVRPEAEYFRIPPPSGYGLPYDYNYYRFSRRVVDEISPLMQAQNFRFVYQRMSVANYSGVALSRKFDIPLILEYNGSEAWIAKHWGRPLDDHELAVKTEDACLRHAHIVVTISDVLRDELIGRGVEAERIVMYPNCIDEAVFNPSKITVESSRELRRQYGIAEDATVVGFIGTFGQWHGVEVLAQALRQLALERADWLRHHRVHFLIVGDGLRMGDVRKALDHPTCSGHYTLTGLVQQHEAVNYLAACDILSSPHVANPDGTRFFGSPTKLFEYMAMGKAIVASDLDQIGEILRNSVRVEAMPEGPPNSDDCRLAILVRPGDVTELIRGLTFAVEQPAWRKVLGQNARAEALSKYTWKHHVQAILSRLSEMQVG